MWTICLLGRGTLIREEVFTWVADRDAGCVVALDSALMEVESWEVTRPTALVSQRGGLFVQSAGGGETFWWRLESGSQAIRCAAPEITPGVVIPPDHPLPGLQGEPTAWAQSGVLSLIATPGAVHLYTEDGVLRGIQGGFRWISGVATPGGGRAVAQGMEP